MNEEVLLFKEALESFSEIDSGLDYGNAIMSTSKFDELFKAFGKQKIQSWLEQFEECDQPTAIEVFYRIKYYNSSRILDYCKLGHDRFFTISESNWKDTIFVSMGDAAKNGEIIAYLFRVANGRSY